MPDNRNTRGDYGRDDFETDDLRYRGGLGGDRFRDENRDRNRNRTSQHPGQQRGESYSPGSFGGDYGARQQGGFDREYNADFDGGSAEQSWRGSGSQGGQQGGYNERLGFGHRGDFDRSTGHGSGRSGAGQGDAGYREDLNRAGQSRGGWNDRSSGGWSGRSYGGSERGAAESGRSGDRGFWDKASDEVSSWFGDEDAERRRKNDEHRGRGPKGYTRSDERIRDDVNDRLTDDGSVDASHIDVAVASQEVTLSGTVSTRFEKRHAEDVAESVSGVKHVQNNLRVQTQGQASTNFGQGERIDRTEGSGDGWARGSAEKSMTTNAGTTGAGAAAAGAALSATKKSGEI